MINVEKSEIVQEILSRSAANASKAIEAGSWRELKLILRFLGCLQGLFEDDGVFPVLEDLFARAVDLQTTSSEDVSVYACDDWLRLTRTSQTGPWSRTCEDYSSDNALCPCLVSLWV
jgi:hypothetical protein